MNFQSTEIVHAVIPVDADQAPEIVRAIATGTEDDYEYQSSNEPNLWTPPTIVYDTAHAAEIWRLYTLKNAYNPDKILASFPHRIEDVQDLEPAKIPDDSYPGRSIAVHDDVEFERLSGFITPAVPERSETKDYLSLSEMIDFQEPDESLLLPGQWLCSGHVASYISMSVPQYNPDTTDGVRGCWR